MQANFRQSVSVSPQWPKLGQLGPTLSRDYGPLSIGRCIGSPDTDDHRPRGSTKMGPKSIKLGRRSGTYVGRSRHMMCDDFGKLLSDPPPVPHRSVFDQHDLGFRQFSGRFGVPWRLEGRSDDYFWASLDPNCVSGPSSCRFCRVESSGPEAPSRVRARSSARRRDGGVNPGVNIAHPPSRCGGPVLLCLPPAKDGAEALRAHRRSAPAHVTQSGGGAPLGLWGLCRTIPRYTEPHLDRPNWWPQGTEDYPPYAQRSARWAQTL